jgi:hypothetical protein
MHFGHKKGPYTKANVSIKVPLVRPNLIDGHKKDLHQGNSTPTKVSLVYENRPVAPGIQPY